MHRIYRSARKIHGRRACHRLQPPPRRPTVAVAMSGGIDSSVAALLLQDKGYNIVGVFMKNWDPSDEMGSEACSLDNDHKDMQEVCQRLGIPAYEVSSETLAPSNVAHSHSYYFVFSRSAL